MALVKYNNNSISAITTAGQLASGGMVLIKEQTASSSASISFVDGTSDVVLDSTYPIYKFEFINIHPATDNVDFTFQVSTNGGSSYGVSITSTFFISYQEEDGDPVGLSYNTGMDLANSTNEQHLQYDIGNDNDQNLSGFLHLFNPSSTTYVKHYLYNGNGNGWLDVSQNCFTAGYVNSTNAVDGVRFKFSSGNIDSGTIKLYGIKDS